jgi:hypothetical protein
VAQQVDGVLAAKQQAAGLQVAPICEDATFLRRAYVDLAGRTPPFLAARDFLADSSQNKRQKLVETLLASDEFAEHWGSVLTVMLTDRRPVRVESHDGRVLREYLSDALRKNRSYREIARELLAGRGLSESSGPANFLLRYDVQPNQSPARSGRVPRRVAAMRRVPQPSVREVEPGRLPRDAGVFRPHEAAGRQQRG